MAEDITLAAPVRVDPGASVFRIASLYFDWEQARVTVVLRAWNRTGFVGAHRVEVTYDGAVAVAMMTGLNKVNLSTRSLHQRVLDRLLADGKIPAGTVAGAVD